ncbi:MAG: tetratricopeptide repeat protein [Candidatus Latescibacterota bacterium]|nr:tetratricopeptide repeat protein [Candidatus Latescibacterota bacterium]
MQTDKLLPISRLALVFSAALCTRALYLYQIDASPLFSLPAVDGKTYVNLALSLSGGNWLGQGQGPFWQPPLYPYLLGVLRLITEENFFYAIRWTQLVLGSLNCVLIYVLGAKWYSARIGLIAAIVAVAYGPLIFFDGEVLPATLATFLNLCGLLLLNRSMHQNSRFHFWASGFTLGLASLTVANTLSFIVAATGWILWRKRTIAPALFFALGVLLTIAPVTWRNYAIGKDTVALSYNSGINFYIGNNAHYDETFHIRPGWEWDDLVSEPRVEGILASSEQSTYFWNKAFSYIREQPISYALLLMRKTLYFFNGHEAGRNQDIYYWRTYSPVLSMLLWKTGIAFPFGIVAPLALLGLILAVRRGLTLDVLYTVVYSASVIAFFPTARYRIPIIPLFILLAIYASFWLWERREEGAIREFRKGLVCCAIGALLANFASGPMQMEGDAEIHYNLGQAYTKQRRGEQAVEHFKRAVKLDPTYWQAWLNLGSLNAMQGKLYEAKDIFHRVAQAQPQRAEIWVNLAHVHRSLRQDSSAIDNYLRALTVNPRQPRIYAELLQLYFQRGETKQAKALLDMALENYPRDQEKLLRLFDDTRQRVER